MSKRPRLDPDIFHLPIDRMREGYYSDKYFVRAGEVLKADGHHPHVTMQVFSKTKADLGGIDEAIAILKLCSDDFSSLDLRALYEGDPIDPWETVMTIDGPYDQFAHLETLYLGVLARRTRVGTNTRLVVEAAAPKEVMFFPARHDHWLVQTGDGYAAHVAGAAASTTLTSRCRSSARPRRTSEESTRPSLFSSSAPTTSRASICGRSTKATPSIRGRPS